MKKIFKIIIVIAICFSTSMLSIEAKSYIRDLFKYEENIKIDKKLEGTAFIAGDKVDINNEIDGIGFIAGNKININSKQKYIFGIGETINIKNEISNDLFLAGLTINIDKDSIINRDTYIYSESLTIDGTIKRNIYVYGTSVEINGTIDGNITISAMNIKIDENSKINGTLKYNKDAQIEGLSKNIKTKTYDISSENMSFKDYIGNLITRYIHITLLGIVLVFAIEIVFKKSLKQTEKANASKLASLCGKGFLILIGVPIIAMMLLLTGAFVSVGTITIILYGILLYISEIFTAYFIAKILDEKVFKRNLNSYMLIIIGLFILYIISIIPIIGGFVSFLSILLGMGIIGNMIIELKK